MLSRPASPAESAGAWAADAQRNATRTQAWRQKDGAWAAVDGAGPKKKVIRVSRRAVVAWSLAGVGNATRGDVHMMRAIGDNQEVSWDVVKG